MMRLWSSRQKGAKVSEFAKDKDVPNKNAGDLISRQAAIDAVADGLKRAFVEYRDVAEKLLKNLPSAQPEQQWIPCSERPDKAGWYLCTYKDGRVNTKYWSKDKGWVDNIRLHMFELYDIRSRLTKEEVKLAEESIYWDDWVKAWMPLPDPYKEEADDPER